MKQPRFRLDIVDASADRVVVRLSGELDLASADAVFEQLRDALADASRILALDLAELSFLDSTGMMVPCQAHDLAELQGLVLILVSPGRQLLRLVELLELDGLLLSTDRSFLGEPASNGRRRTPRPER
jgi:anti-anti-sigma factor